MIRIGSNCPRGHEQTAENVLVRRKPGLVSYDCRECQRIRTRKNYIVRRAARHALAIATIEREQMHRCPNCASVGKVGFMEPDKEGDMVCRICTRGPKVTLILGDVDICKRGHDMKNLDNVKTFAQFGRINRQCKECVKIAVRTRRAAQ